MKFVLIVEGKTEKVFIPYLRQFLESRLQGSMPSIRAHCYDGRIPKGDKLKRLVERLLNDGQRSADHVVALTDVYTGTPDFVDASDAIAKMRTWVGVQPKFHPHAAQHDFEAWLLPYWQTIQVLAQHNKAVPSGAPESVNHTRPPAHYIQEIFTIGGSGRKYVKTRDAKRILDTNTLDRAVSACPQLKALVNTVLIESGVAPIP